MIFLALAFAAALAIDPAPADPAPPAPSPAVAIALPPLAPGTEAVHTGSDAEGRMTVDVGIAGHGPFRFMVDTGAERTVLSAGLAARLGVVAGGQRRVMGVAGPRDVGVADVPGIRLGTRDFSASAVPILADADIGADGILGLDGLQGQRVLLDFAQHRITFEAPRRGEDAGFEIVVTGRRRGGQLILTHAVIDGVDTDVVLDTGAEMSVGNRALQRALYGRQAGGRQAGAGGATLISVTGQTLPADIASARGLDVGALHIAGLTFAFADSPAFAALRLDRRPALLLGMRELRLFRRVAIDFATRRVLFDIGAASPRPALLAVR